MVHGVSSGHPGGSLGCVEILTLLFFEEMQLNPDAFDMDGIGEDLFFYPMVTSARFGTAYCPDEAIFQ